MNTLTGRLRARVVAGTAAAAVLAGRALAQGPDLIVGDITSSSAYVLGGSPKAYSLGLSYCNLGDGPANFDATSGQHPVVTQNMYRLQDGRFEQIGQAWAAHLLAGAVQLNLCSTCTPWPDGTKLGAGCSSTDSAATLGTQINFGAKSEVDAATETFTWPRVNMGTGSGNAFKRLQVAIADMPPGPLYFVSAMIVSGDDAGHVLNNESYRRVTIGFAGAALPLTMADTTQRGAPAIQAWKDNGLGIGMPDPDVRLAAADADGRFWVASKATPIAGGGWHYEYAVQNLSSDRSGGRFVVPVPLQSGAGVANFGFHAVAYHSGEVYTPGDWVVTQASDGVWWSCPQTFDQNPNANALRWDTIYNFWFDCSLPPGSASAVIGLFKPGAEPDPSAVVAAPVNPCGSADFNCDGAVGTDADIESFFECLSGACPPPPCTSTADFNGDGAVGTDADIEAFFRVLAGGQC
jgi:hypothetical protein